MCVHESGDHAPAAEVCHSPSGIGQVCLSSDPRDSAVLHDHGIRIGGGAVRGKNFSVNKYSSVLIIMYGDSEAGSILVRSFFLFSEEKEPGDRMDFIEMQRGEAEDGYDFR